MELREEDFIPEAVGHKVVEKDSVLVTAFVVLLSSLLLSVPIFQFILLVGLGYELAAYLIDLFSR